MFYTDFISSLQFSSQVKALLSDEFASSAWKENALVNYIICTGSSYKQNHRYSDVFKE